MKAWRCFEPYGEDPQEYAWATRLVPTSCEDAVIAADSWGAPMQRMTVPPARGGSVEAALHEAAGGPTLFVFSPDERPSWASQTMDHRAIGVVYDPQRELAGNYVPTVLADRYDAFCFFDDSSAVHPLHLEPAATRGEPDTYPSGR